METMIGHVFIPVAQLDPWRLTGPGNPLSLNTNSPGLGLPPHPQTGPATPPDWSCLPPDWACLPPDWSCLPPDWACLPPDWSCLPPDWGLPPPGLGLRRPHPRPGPRCRAVLAPQCCLQFSHKCLFCYDFFIVNCFNVPLFFFSFFFYIVYIGLYAFLFYFFNVKN